MILQCPSCDARFLVPDQAMGAGGRRVRCGRCSYVWSAKPPPADIPDLDALMAGAVLPQLKARPLPPGSNLPARRAQKSAFGLIALNLLLLVLVAGMAVGMYRPHWIGMTGTQGLVLEEVQFVEGAPPDSFIVKGRVVNTTDTPIKLPNLRISLVDEHKNVLKSWPPYEQEGTLVTKAEPVSFQTEPLHADGLRGAHFIVEIGSPLELALRRAKLWSAP